MELRDIEYFAVVAEHGHLGRAAEALGLSTPALSKSLRRLEKSMQAKLVRRTPKGVDLTSVGTALLGQVSRLRLMMGDVTREAADLTHGRAGDLRIGAGSAHSEYFLPRACGALLKDAQRVTLKITILSSHDQMLLALRKGEFDLVLTTVDGARPEGLVREYLFDTDLVVYVAANHRLARRKRIELADLTQEQWTLSGPESWPWRRLHQVLADHQLPPPKVAMMSNSVLLRLDTVASSDLLMLGANHSGRLTASHSRLVTLRVKELEQRSRMGVIYRDDAYLPPAARRLIEVLKATARVIAEDSQL
jgi:DNA-binding transcriptional LysR family regulator